MGRSTGTTLRYHRVLSGLTQEELGEGVVSTSYLSKIEKGNETPSEEVLSLLMKKLGLSKDDFISDEEIIEELRHWNKMITLNQVNEATDYFNINHDRYNGKEVKETIIYQAFKLHYNILMEDFQQAEETYYEINNIDSSLLDEELLFYINFFKGVYLYKIGSFKNAYKLLLVADEFTNKVKVTQYELAHLYYRLGLCCSRIRQVYQGLIYTEKALQIYSDDYNLQRMCDCHLLLGATYSNARIFDKAETHFEKAEKIVHAFENNYTLSMIYHNQAFLEVEKGNSNEAIKKFESSYNYKLQLDNPSLLLSTINCLAIEYLRIGEFKKSSDWINNGLSLLEDLEVDFSNENYYYHFETMKKYLNQEDSFENFLVTETFPHFRMKNQHEYIARYNHLLGKYYERLNKHKKASECFQITLNLLKKNEYYGGLIL